jgi:hypothetical protein
MGNYTVVPILRISPGLVYAYDILDPKPSKRPGERHRSYDIEISREKYTGLLSPGARRKLIKYINLLVAISLPKKAKHFQSGKEFTFRVNFITLTLPAAQKDVSDTQLKQTVLKSWLEYWKQKCPGMSYVWRAERQKNGNLHFHICTDRYILYSEIRDTWNTRLARYHFIDEFEKSHGHRHPNSTDVHAVAHIKNLGAYIAKYMSKLDPVGQHIKGRCWDCSANLKKKDHCEMIIDTQVERELCETINHFKRQVFSTDFCSGFRFTESEAISYFPPRWKALFEEYLERVRSG